MGPFFFLLLYLGALVIHNSFHCTLNDFRYIMIRWLQNCRQIRNHVKCLYRRYMVISYVYGAVAAQNYALCAWQFMVGNLHFEKAGDMYSVLTSNECCPFHTIFRYRSKAAAEVVKIGFHCCCSYSLTLSVCAAWCWLRSFKSSYNIPLCRAHVKLKQIMQVFCFLQRFALSVFFLLRLYIFIGLATVNNNCDFFQRSLPASWSNVNLAQKDTQQSMDVFVYRRSTCSLLFSTCNFLLCVRCLASDPNMPLSSTVFFFVRYAKKIKIENYMVHSLATEYSGDSKRKKNTIRISRTKPGLREQQKMCFLYLLLLFWLIHKHIFTSGLFFCMCIIHLPANSNTPF